MGIGSTTNDIDFYSHLESEKLPTETTTNNSTYNDDVNLYHHQQQQQQQEQQERQNEEDLDSTPPLEQLQRSRSQSPGPTSTQVEVEVIVDTSNQVDHHRYLSEEMEEKKKNNEI